MIQNILTFCVKNDLTYVDGSLPSGKLVANDVNRNSIYLITPYNEAVVKANFQTNLQSDTPTSVIGILVDGKISVDELVDKDKSYYNLVKNWHIYEFKVPSTTLSFISRNRTGQIGINFSIEQRVVPAIKPSYGEFLGEIIDGNVSILVKDGYAINKTIGFELDTSNVITYDLNDILVFTKNPNPQLEDSQVKISAYSNRGSTPTAMYSVDPSLLNDNFETIEPSLTEQIIEQVNDNTGDIVAINLTLNGVLDDIVDLENRISQAEQDIDTAESNITKLQGRMATAESDIDNIENGTTVVEKALRDSLGNVIKDHYVSSVIPTYDDNTNNFYLNPYNGNDSLMPTRVEGVTLPKATTSKDGLMAKEDKAKVDNIASDISSAITTHDNSATAHLPLRTLINNLQQEVDRINAKGRSWGEVDKTYSELVAMGEPTMSEYISDFLAIKFGHTPAEIGDLVYTKVSDTEPEYEMEFNGSLWVSNGAYLVSKASNTQMGLVQGDLDYVSILNGIIQVLKSDYATNVGSSGASYDYADLLALFTEVANDIYKKNETYSATQIEQRITDLLGLANLQDVLIGSYTDGQTVLASDLSPYNFVIVLGKDGNNTYTGTFKPSEIVSGNIVSLSTTVYLTRDATSFTITTPTSVKLWGIKLDGIDASDISYNNETVESALDSLLVPEYITATHEALQTEITATDAFEINDETGDVVKITGNEPDNLVDNGDFSDGVSPWTNYYNAALELVDGRLRATKNTATNISTILQPKVIEINTTDVYYFACNFESSSILNYFRFSAYKIPESIEAQINSRHIYIPANTPAFISHIGSFDNTFSANMLGFGFYTQGAVGTDYFVDNLVAYNITDFKKAGVVNDSGTLFSRLTNGEIKDQMDIWTEVGFPDHVIHALYPNGVDSAIALKYNDADDIFRPQQIDTLPINLTLRSGEYWQDGYIIKQNGNAEYHPLNTKFSAWNYGQLEAVYASGVPADFDIRYAQNTASQVKTTQEFLVEAREQLDYVTEGYDNLVEKLGDAILTDRYDSYAGITSDTYEYYTLEGIKEGNTLAIEGAGQSIQNLLGKGGTINATTTVRGVTVTYDSATGVFTANGTATAGAAFNITLATGMDFDLPVGTPMQLMRYYDAADGGTVDLNGSYIGYVLLGTAVRNRINENSEALYDPYINASGNLTANHATNKQQLLLQVWAPGITFTNFKFKIGIYEGLQLRPFILPSGEPAKSNVTVYNRNANKLNMPTALNIEDSGITLTYDPLVQEFLLSGTATATKDISLNATFNVLSGDRLSIKRLYQSGDITAAGGTLPRIKLVNSGGTAIVYNDIYKMTAPEGQTPTPDVSFNTGTAPADDTLTLKLGITSGQVFDNYRFRLMIHDKSTDIGYVAYRRELVGNMSVGANERAVVEFKAIPYGVLEFVADSESLNLLFADSITDLNKTYLEYNAGIMSPNRKISELTARLDLIDNPFRNKVIAVWGDSRESNNPTSDPNGVGDQKDTSWPAFLAKKLNATVLNYGLSGGAWAENTVQQDAASAIVNRVLTEDVSASADVIIISSMNDFKLASVLGSPSPDNKDKTTFYGAMRLTYDRLATKYPGKKIVLVLPQKRYDETVNYGGGSYYHYLKAQVEVAKEYGIPIVDLYHNFPNAKPTFYATNMLNDTHFSAVGNEKVAELVARELIGNGNKGDMDVIPPIPTTDGTYTLKVTITGGIPVFSWVVD